MKESDENHMSYLSTWYTGRDIDAQPSIWSSFDPEVLAQRAKLRTQLTNITAPTVLADTRGAVVQVLPGRMALNVDDPFAGKVTPTDVKRDAPAAS